MRQHYLPRCYLNEFCGKNRSLYSLNSHPFKLGKIPSPQIKHPASVCFEKDFYSVDFNSFLLTEQLAKAERFVIEEGFHWYENDYPKIIRKIKNGIPLTYIEAYTLSYMFIDLKIRNKYWRENGIEAKKHSLIYNTLTKIETDESVYERFNITKERAREVASFVKDKLYNENTLSKQLHLNGLLTAKNQESIQNRIAEILIGLKWNVFTRANGDFITNDNPGICVDHQEKAHNTRFAPGFIFIMPLTPELCIVIDDRIPDLDLLDNRNTKGIYLSPLSDAGIEIINRSCMFHINKYIFGKNIEHLNRMSTEIHKKFSPENLTIQPFSPS